MDSQVGRAIVLAAVKRVTLAAAIASAGTAGMSLIAQERSSPPGAFAPDLYTLPLDTPRGTRDMETLRVAFENSTESTWSNMPTSTRADSDLLSDTAEPLDELSPDEIATPEWAQSRIAGYEQEHGLSSEDFLHAIAQGKELNTTKLAHWKMLLEVKELLEEECE